MRTIARNPALPNPRRLALSVPRIASRAGLARVTVTDGLGVASTTEGDQKGMVADADVALFHGKRQGKNRSIKAAARAPDVVNAE
jgi:hypothetical protein